MLVFQESLVYVCQLFETEAVIAIKAGYWTQIELLYCACSPRFRTVKLEYRSQMLSRIVT